MCTLQRFSLCVSQPCTQASSALLRPTFYFQAASSKFESRTRFSRSSRCDPKSHLSYNSYSRRCFGHAARKAGQDSDWHQDQGEGWKARPAHFSKPGPGRSEREVLHSEPDGSGARVGAGERPRYPAGAPGRAARGCQPAARIPDPAPPRRPRVAGGAQEERRAGLCGAASPPSRAGGGRERGTEVPGASRASPAERAAGEESRAACNRWEAGWAGAGARAASRQVARGARGRPGGGGGSELAGGGGLSPAPACPAWSEDAGGRCPGPGTRSVTRRCSCWPSSAPAGPWSTTAARISSTTCGTAPDPGSATQVSGTTLARAQGWELGPRRGLRLESDADLRGGRGGEEGASEPGKGMQNPARSGLMLEARAGTPAGGCCAEAESGWAGAEAGATTPVTCAGTDASPGGRLPEIRAPRYTSWDLRAFSLSERGGRAGRPRSGGKRDWAREMKPKKL